MPKPQPGRCAEEKASFQALSTSYLQPFFKRMWVLSLRHAAAGGCPWQWHVPGAGRARGGGAVREAPRDQPQIQPRTPLFAEPRPIANTKIPSPGCPARCCQPGTKRGGREGGCRPGASVRLNKARVPPSPSSRAGFAACRRTSSNPGRKMKAPAPQDGVCCLG